jgi:HK97 gp10 family phage protein
MPAIVAGMSALMAQLDEVGLQFTLEDIVPGAEIILARAQDNCPVDTGFLRASGNLFMDEGRGDVLIGFDAEYASYVEFGTYKMEAQPFLRPAIDEASDEALSAIVTSVESHMRDITQ